VLGVIAGLAVAVASAVQGYRATAATWTVLTALLLLQSGRDRIAFGLRKWATALLLLGLAALFGWGAIVWYRERSLPDAAVEAYLAIVCAGIALWAVARWSSMPPVAAQSPRLIRFALGSAIISGFFVLLGISQITAGDVASAVVTWGMSVVSMAIAVGVLVLQARINSQLDVARRLGFEDLHVYLEARRSQGFSLEQMAGETGLKPDALRRAGKAWRTFRRARASSP